MPEDLIRMAIPNLTRIPFTRVEMPVKGHPIVFLHTRSLGSSFAPLDTSFVAKPEEWGAFERSPAAAKQVFAKSIEAMASLFAATTSHFPEFRSLDDREVALVRARAPEDKRDTLPVEKNTWVVMSFVHSLKDLAGLAAKGGSTARSVFSYIMKTPRVMRELGRILVVDLFNGSGDRFFVRDARRVAGVQNLGNLFVVSPDGLFLTCEFCGIDFWDPSSEYKDLYVPIGPGWNGDLLHDGKKAELERMAKAIVTQLPAKIAEAAKGGHAADEDDEGPAPRVVLGSPHAKEFVTGTREGKAALKAHLQRLIRTGGVPSGVVSRMRALAW